MLLRPLKAAPLVLAAALLMTACSDTGSTTGSPESDNGTTSSGIDTCIAAMTDAVEAARGDVDLVLPEAGLDLSETKGKNLWVINVLTNQFISDANEGFEAAAKAAGANLTIFDGQGSANTWNEGVQQAIAQGADAIALFGVDSQIVSEAVKEATDAGIPVTESLATTHGRINHPDLYSSFSADYYADGAALAEWTLADSQCTADTYLLYSSAMPIWIDMKEGIQDVYEEHCPDCVLTAENVDLANVATELPRLTQTKLTQSPNTKYLLATWDSAAPFIESAASQINPDAVILGRDGLAEFLDEIRSGGMSQVTVAAPPAQWIGWTVIDDLLRASTGLDPNGLQIPTRLVDSTNIGESFDDVMPNYKDFETAYVEAWEQ